MTSRKGRRWTAEEDEALRALLPHHRQPEIARFLGRPEQGVYTRCHRLGLVSLHPQVPRGEENALWKGGTKNN